MTTDITDNVSTTFVPRSDDQAKAIAAIEKFLHDSVKRLFLVEGYAGVGKTALIQHIVRQQLIAGKRVAMTAPVNKAVGVLKRSAAENGITPDRVTFTTIYSLLGLALVKDDEKEDVRQIGSSDLHFYKLVIIDECSMVNKALYAMLLAAVNSLGNGSAIKVICLGDPGQLNPVNERRSPTFSVPDKVTLTQVVRQAEGNPLLEYVTAIREYVAGEQRHQVFKPYRHASDDKQQGALMIDRQTLLKYAKKKARNFAEAPDDFRILCWTNKQVNYYNDILRSHLYGEDAEAFVVGERLIAQSPIVAPDGKLVLVQTSTEFIVQAVVVTQYNGYKAWKLFVQLDNKHQAQIYALHEDDRPKFEAESDRLIKAARKQRYLWRNYYKHLEMFADVRPCFALTVHKSQGSTYKECAIIARDLAKRANDGDRQSILEHNRLWYVAASRATTRVLIVK
jgi:ATP-dependent exoDNAse (exonuclease V) alpha subunit